MPLLALAPELLCEIFGHVPRDEDSPSNVQLICRQLLPVTRRIFYRHVEVIGLMHFLALLRTLEENADLRALIKSFTASIFARCKSTMTRHGRHRCVLGSPPRAPAGSSRWQPPVIPVLRSCTHLSVQREENRYQLSSLELCTWILRCPSLEVLTLVNVGGRKWQANAQGAQQLIESGGGWPSNLRHLNIQ